MIASRQFRPGCTHRVQYCMCRGGLSVEDVESCRLYLDVDVAKINEMLS